MKSLLVHVDNSFTCKVRIELALSLAGKFGARLTALYVKPTFLMPVYAEAPPEIDELIRQAGLDSEKMARKRCESVEHTSGEQIDWRAIEGDPVNTICESARCFDLVILGQYNPDDPSDLNLGVADHVVPGAGTPCLIVPYIARKIDITGTALIAWNGTRESARAIRDAIPFLQKATRVELLCINPERGDEGNGAGEDMCAYLLEHGIKSKLHRLHNKDIPAGDILLSHAADISADFLVAGAYGHTRLREKILGGVTRHLLEHMTNPVLMSH